MAAADEYERLLSDDGDDRDDDGDRPGWWSSSSSGSASASGADHDHDPQCDVERPRPRRRRRLAPLRARLKAAYGLGHVFNDISATIWFSYTMVFVQNVIGVPSTVAGFLMFLGIVII